MISTKDKVLSAGPLFWQPYICSYLNYNSIVLDAERVLADLNEPGFCVVNYARILRRVSVAIINDNLNQL